MPPTHTATPTPTETIPRPQGAAPFTPTPTETIPSPQSAAPSTGGGGGGSSQPRVRCTNGTVVPDPGTNAELVAECVLLLGIKGTLEGQVSVAMRLNWSEARSIDTWEGITIGSDSPRRVVKVELDSSRKTLHGRIPANLYRLTELQTLDFSNNRLTSFIPIGLRQLAELNVLDFSNNRLTGRIPTDLANLSNLRVLSLAGNQLSGCIPNALMSVANHDLSRLGLPFCDPVTPTATPTPPPTALADVQIFLPFVRK